MSLGTLFALALAAALPHGAATGHRAAHRTTHRTTPHAAPAQAPAAAPVADQIVAAPPHQPVAKPENFDYALVVTNNRSLNVGRPDLHYADDDGIKYAELFSEAFGLDHVTLLTTLDPESSRMYPAWQARAMPPSRDNLARAVSVLAERAAAHPGARVFLVFAGHGDIDHGQGFVELEDGRLTADALNTEILAQLTQARVNLILDSCNSYFMINPRKPGMQRWQAPAPVNKSLLDLYPNLGVIISTSAEAAAYEWSELQSGIFSYELRSALRGAADADGDGRVSYAEVEAFITVANQALVNDLYRPKVFSQGPGKEQSKTLLGAFSGPVRTLQVGAAGALRLTIRDRNGVRLLDANKEDGTALRLYVPTEEHDMQVEEVQAPLRVTERPHVLVHTLPNDSQNLALMLDSLPSTQPNLSARGEAPVFSNLFQAPFGHNAFVAFHDNSNEDRALYGVTAQDERRLALHLGMAADLQRDSRLLNGAVLYTPLLIGAGLTGAILGVNYRGPNDLRLGDQVLLISAGAVELSLAAMGAYFTFTPDGTERLRDQYETLPKKTEAERASAVLQTELSLYKQVRWLRVRRYVLGSVLATVGASMLVQQITAGWFAPGNRDKIAPSLSLAVTAGLIVDGLYVLLLHRDPVERVWDLYVDQRDAFGSGMPPQPFSPAVQVSVAPYSYSDYPKSPTGFAFYLGGTF